MRIVIKGIGKPQQNTYDGGDEDDDDEDDDSFVDKHNHVDHIKRRQLHNDGAKQQILNDQAQDDAEQEEQDQQNTEDSQHASQADKNQQEQEQQQQEQQQQEQEKQGDGDDGGDEDGDGDDGEEGGEKKGKLAKAKEKIGAMKGAFGDWKKGRENRKKLKQLKRKTKVKDALDKSLGPYHKTMIPEKHVKQVAAREQGEVLQPVTYSQKQLLDKFQEKQELGKKIQQTTPDQANDVDKLESEYKKKEDEVKKEAQHVQRNVFTSDFETLLSGPTGCWKDCKAAFLTLNAIAISVIGGIVAMILGLCGVF